MVLLRYLSHRFVRAHFDPIPLRWPLCFLSAFCLLFPFLSNSCLFPTTTIPHTQLFLRERERRRHCCHIPAIPLFILFLPFEFSYIYIYILFFPLRVTKRVGRGRGGRRKWRMPAGLIECWNEKRRKRKSRVKHEQ